MRRLAQSTAYTVMMKLFDSSDHVSAKTGATVAITISKAGGAFGNPNAGASNATEVSNGWYKFALDTTDTNTLGDLVIRGTASGADAVEQVMQVVSATTGGASNLDAAISSRSSHAAADVWSVGTRLLSAGTNIVLAKGTGLTGLNDIAAGAAMTLTSGERTAIANEVEAQIIDDTDSEKVLTAITDKIASVNPSLDDLTLAGIASAVRTELGTELGRIDAAISTRSTYAGTDTAGTTTLLSRLTNTRAGNLDNLDAAVTTRMATYAQPTGFLAATFPSDPADQSLVIAATDALASLIGDVPTNAELTTALAGADDAVLTQIALVKAKTDQLVFTKTNELDVNIQSVNGVTVNGDGAGTPWGP